jgi:hypothetical protein
MKVRELIAELHKCNLDELVVVGGGDFTMGAPLDYIELSRYEPDSSWDGSLYDREEEEMGEDCVTLWKIH